MWNPNVLGDNAMKLKLLELTLQSDSPMHDDASKLRGFFDSGSMNMPSNANM